MHHPDIIVPSPLEPLHWPGLSEKGIDLYIKRDDLIHPIISGNKWRKLELNLEQAKLSGHTTLLTLGGAHSNHIAATAEAARIFGFESIGIIRGHAARLDNYTLSRAIAAGMRVEKVSKIEFDAYQTWAGKDALKSQFGSFYFIPQGGANHYGIQGCQAIVNELPFAPDRIFLPTATGTTLAGITIANKGRSQISAIAVLKQGAFIKELVRKELLSLLGDTETVDELMAPVDIFTEYHFGGYAKYSEELISFTRRFFELTGIRLDPVYTAKAAFAMMDLADRFPPRTPEKWVLIHTGGLQGIPAMEAQMKELIFRDC